MKGLKMYPPSKQIVLIDFDNTITPFDVLDDIIKRFSVDRRWVALEKAWKEGRIGSKECLEGQLRSVRITKNGLSRYLSSVRVDPSFKRLLSLFKKRGIKTIIVSDSFSFIIKQILKKNMVRELPIYSNRMRFRKDVIIPAFPYRDGRCHRCANCKKMHLSKYRDRYKMVIYIGDGLSDLCPAKHSDLVFAKGSLLGYMRREKKRCVEFKDLGDVCSYFS